MQHYCIVNGIKLLGCHNFPLIYTLIKTFCFMSDLWISCWKCPKASGGKTPWLWLIEANIVVIKLFVIFQPFFCEIKKYWSLAKLTGVNDWVVYNFWKPIQWNSLPTLPNHYYIKSHCNIDWWFYENKYIKLTHLIWCQQAILLNLLNFYILLLLT